MLLKKIFWFWWRKKKSDSEFLSYNLMLNSGNQFHALCDKKNKYSNFCVVRKKNSERNRKPYPPWKLNGRSLKGLKDKVFNKILSKKNAQPQLSQDNASRKLVTTSQGCFFFIIFCNGPRSCLTRVLGENHRPAIREWQTLSHTCNVVLRKNLSTLRYERDSNS